MCLDVPAHRRREGHAHRYRDRHRRYGGLLGRKLTDEPLIVCYTHSHMDHTGGAGAFDNAHIHPKDMADFLTGGAIGHSIERRGWYIKMIAEREKGDYPYDLAADVTEWGLPPPLTPLEDGQVIDLGNRRITVIACPGHSAGSVTIAACEQIIAGTATVARRPSPLRPGTVQHFVTVGRTSVSFNPEGIR